jgi:Flp pilus assembly protein TadD
MSKRSQQIDAFFRQGQQLHMAGRLAEAEPIYRQVLAAMPRHAEALHALGALALQAGQADAAVTVLDQAIALKPAADFLLTKANALLALKRPREAARIAEQVLRVRGRSAEAWQLLGHAHSDAGEPDQAIAAYRRALDLKPDLADIRNNLGMALRQANRLEDAEREMRQAPPEPEALVNLSSVQKERGAFADAEATLRQALRLAPENPVLRYNWSLLMLLLGRTQEAWDGWEQRFRAGAVPIQAFAQPQWRGEPLNGRTLLIYAEQGLGDAIQFVRYLPALRGLGTVIFQAHPRLMRLLASNKGLPPMIPVGSSLPHVDVVIPLMSLPARTDTPSVQPPYLFAEPDRVALWKDRIGPSGFRIGINWQGFPGRFEDKGRSLPLSAFAPLAAMQGVRLISLQKDAGEQQLAASDFAVETLAGLDDGPDAFLDTAAVMANLDLIVTSDTSIAHLAGALGRPVWVVLRRVPDWRWMLDRADSPWYPTMRLFRQTTDGDWTTLFADIQKALPR